MIFVKNWGKKENTEKKIRFKNSPQRQMGEDTRHCNITRQVVHFTVSVMVSVLVSVRVGFVYGLCLVVEAV